MSQFGKIEVTDKDGWRKEHPLQKNIVHIGSDSRNDVVLDSARGSGVSPRHLQLIAVESQGFRMVNIGGADVAVGAAGERMVPPLGVLDIGFGERVKVGDFVLALYGGPGGAMLPPPSAATASRGGVGSSAERASGCIGLSVSFPNTQLPPDRPIDGVVVVRNQGDKTGAQFKIEIEGLEPECYEIGPGPILFPDSEKSVALRIHHPRKPNPPAGEHRLRIRATAPTAYPGDSAAVTQLIYIMPFHSHSLRLIIPE